MASGALLRIRLLKPVLFAAVGAVAGAARAGQSPSTSTCSTSPRREPARRDRRDRARARGRTGHANAASARRSTSGSTSTRSTTPSCSPSTPSSTGSSTTKSRLTRPSRAAGPQEVDLGPPTPHHPDISSHRNPASLLTRDNLAQFQLADRSQLRRVREAVKCRQPCVTSNAVPLSSARNAFSACARVLAMCSIRGVTHGRGERLAAGDPRGTEARRHRRTIIVTRECSG